MLIVQTIINSFIPSATGQNSETMPSMEYMDTFEEYGNGENYISSLKARESVTVKMAWIIEETDLENMYLNLTGEGAYSEITERMLDTGLVVVHKK